MQQYYQQQPPQQQPLQQIPQQYMLQGLPQRPPFTVNITVLPEMQTSLSYITGITMHEIQSKANANTGRQAVFYQASQNGWQNEYFNKVASEVADYAAYIVITSNGSIAPYPAIQTAASTICTMRTAMLAMSHPGLFQGLAPQVQYDAQQKVAEFNQLGTVLSNFVQQRMGQQQPIGAVVYPTGGYQQQQYHQPQQQYQQQQQQQYYNNNSMQNPVPINRIYAGGGGYSGNPATMHPSGGIATIAGTGYNPQTQQPGGLGNRMGSSLTTKVTNVVAESPQPSVVTQPDSTPKTVPMSYAKPVNQPTITQPQEHESMFIQEPIASPETSLIQIDVNGEFEFEGKRWIQSTKYGKPLVSTKGAGWCTAYDPKIHVVAYHCEADGTVAAVRGFPIKEFAMQPYEQHETVYFLKPPKLTTAEVDVGNYEKARKAFNETIQASDIQQLLAERYIQMGDVDVPAIELELPVVYGDNILVNHPTTNYHALVEGYMKTDGNNVVWNKNTGVRFRNAVQLTSFVNTDAQLSLQALNDVDSWTRVLGILNALRVSLLPADWVTLNDVLTKEVNALIDVDMGLNTTIDNFAEDITDLQQHLQDRMGETISTCFAAAASKVAKAAIVLCGDVNCDKSRCDFAVSYEEICLLGVLSADITIRYEGKAGIILPSRFPEFHAFLQHLLDNPISKRATRATKVVTIDGRVFAVRRSAFSPDTLLITTLYL